MPDPQLDELCVNTIRFLAVDAVQKAKSGHPGAPMGAAPMAYTLWNRFLKHNPRNPDWVDRDRFILSPGHASMLLYSLLHLTGYDVSIDDLKQFRQWGSITPGHPEHGLTPGVEVTSGPLGQGFANGVGMALAEKWLATHFNRDGHNVIDHQVYGIVSDGDLQEGISSEAASLAGTLQLGKIVYLYDDNGISIEGDTDISFKENVGKRFEAYGWHVTGPIDGNDLEAVAQAISAARAVTDAPSLIVCTTQIGYGSPNKAGTGGVHGEPLGEEEVKLTRQALGWTYEEPFTVPDEALSNFRKAVGRGAESEQQWEARLADYRRAFPDEAVQLEAALRGELPDNWDADLDDLFVSDEKPIATRDAGNRVMNAIAQRVHNLVGGSADLAPSTRTLLAGMGDFSSDDYGGRNLHFGVREHAMGAIANGMALHGGVIPYTATFLIFSDYMRPSIRLGAIMGQRVTYIFTHDSIGVGEDGPTHQPVEQVMSLRLIPNLVVIRPADATETAEAWKVALNRTDGPTVLALTRQALPILDHTALGSSEGAKKGGYVLWKASDNPDAILIGTGSEVHQALDAGNQLVEQGIYAWVVSMPSWELFDAQSSDYRDSVLPPSVVNRISIEAGTTVGWEHYVGARGVAIGMHGFGASAPAGIIYTKLGITTERVIEETMKLVE